MTTSSELTLTSGPVSATLQQSSNLLLLTKHAAEFSVSEYCRRAFENPLGFPELIRCVVPGDRVVLAVDPETLFASDIISSIWEQLQTVPDGGVLLTLLLPQDHSGNQWQWLRELLPLHVQEQITVHIHDPADSSQISYIASSGNG